jgi:hypothetical protein
VIIQAGDHLVHANSKRLVLRSLLSRKDGLADLADSSSAFKIAESFVWIDFNVNRGLLRVVAEEVE